MSGLDSKKPKRRKNKKVVVSKAAAPLACQKVSDTETTNADISTEVKIQKIGVLFLIQMSFDIKEC